MHTLEVPDEIEQTTSYIRASQYSLVWYMYVRIRLLRREKKLSCVRVLNANALSVVSVAPLFRVVSTLPRAIHSFAILLSD